MNKLVTTLSFALFGLLLVFIISLNFEHMQVKEENSLGYTDVILTNYFDADTGEIIKGFHKLKEIEAECIEQSSKAARPDAYKCTFSGKTIDPCYVDNLKKPRQLACVEKPWSKSLVLVKLKNNLPVLTHKATDIQNLEPFGIELEDNTKCLVNGSPYEEYRNVAGMSSNSICFDGDLSYIPSKIYGEIDRSESIYRIFFETSESILSKKKIKALYY